MNSSVSVALFSQDVYSELTVRVSESHLFFLALLLAVLVGAGAIVVWSKMDILGPRIYSSGRCLVFLLLRHSVCLQYPSQVDCAVCAFSSPVMGNTSLRSPFHIFIGVIIKSSCFELKSVSVHL